MLEFLQSYTFSLPTRFPSDVLALYTTFFTIAFVLFFITLYQYLSFKSSSSNETPAALKPFFRRLHIATGNLLIYLFVIAVTGRVHPYEGNSIADIGARIAVKLTDVHIFIALLTLLEYYQESPVTADPDGPKLDSPPILGNGQRRKYFYISLAAVTFLVDTTWEILALVQLHVQKETVALFAFWTDQMHDWVFLTIATAYTITLASTQRRWLFDHEMVLNPAIKTISSDLGPVLTCLCVYRTIFHYSLREYWKSDSLQTAMCLSIVDLVTRGGLYVYVMKFLTQIGKEVEQGTIIELLSDLSDSETAP